MIFSLLLLLAGTFPVSAQIVDAEGQYVDTVFNDHVDRTAEDFVIASILISDPVEGVLSLAGHTAIRVQCPTFGLDYVYHYVRVQTNEQISETYAFLTGQFIVQMVADTFASYVQHSEAINRGLTEYYLHLTPQEEQKLWQILDEELVSGKQLKYDFVQEGCAVKTKKLIERVLGKKHIDYSACDPRFSAPQYELVSAAMQCAPWMRFVMLTAMYGHTKQSGCANNLLIPADLATAWQTATVDGRPLLSDGVRIVANNYYQSDGWFTPLRLAIMLLIISIIGLFVTKPYTDWIILGMQLLMSVLVLLFSVMGSTFIVWNWLLIPFNILPAICWKWRKYWALPYATVLAVWCLVMLFVPHMLVDTTHIILALAFAIVLLKQSNILQRFLVKSVAQDTIKKTHRETNKNKMI
ncbi:MAG: DUF4105 domain-containing protein [Paludibacteraceae bacterium]|nr:DUF4105 domain-containing protein [Paludibacteraceae bacterium]